MHVIRNGKTNKKDSLVISSARATRFVSDIDIPSKPSVLQSIDALEDDISAIAKIVMQDLTLSAAVLKVVNSAWVALPNQISRIEQAVVLLGLDSIKNIIRAVCFRTVMEPIAEPKLMKRVWRSSLNTAVCSSVVSRYLHLANPDEAYALGLFHNCGIPVLSSHFNRIEPLVTQGYSDPEANFLLTELKSLNVDHAAIGYRVSSAWNLPSIIGECIRDHHSLKVHDLDSYSQANSLLVALKLGEHFGREHLLLGKCDKDYEWEKNKKMCMEYLKLDDRDMRELQHFCDMHLDS
jgi:HD-like signal output (HDOD) protein